MNSSKWIFLVAAALGAGCASQEKQGEHTGNDAQAGFTRHYRCADGRELTVEYDNSNPAHSLARVQLNPENPEKITLKIAVSASGARYTDGTLVWWTKGNSGTLTQAGDGGEVLAGDCQEFEASAP